MIKPSAPRSILSSLGERRIFAVLLGCTVARYRRRAWARSLMASGVRRVAPLGRSQMGVFWISGSVLMETITWPLAPHDLVDLRRELLEVVECEGAGVAGALGRDLRS